MNNKGDQLETCGQLHTHPEDQEYIIKNFGDYEEILIDEESLVVKSKIIYLHGSGAWRGP